MAVIPINKSNTLLKAYLRADPNSQLFRYSNSSEDFVTPEMFWDISGGIYLDYSQIDNRSIQVSRGISANAGRQTLYNTDCDKWIYENIYFPQSSKLFVIEGYAGCGKTTFISHLIRFHHDPDNYSHIDVGQKWAYFEEPFMFFNESLNGFDCLVDNIMAKSRWTRDKIWKQFFDLGSSPERNELGSEIYNAVLGLKNVKEHSTPHDLRNHMHEYLFDNYNRSSPVNYEDSNIEWSTWHSTGRTQTIITLIILLKCAEYSVENRRVTSSNKYSLIFDNLDIITDPAIPAENAFMLLGVIDHYRKFKRAYHSRTHCELPDFVIFITVRKVLLSHITSHITSHLPNLEMDHPYDISCAFTCDISNLYSSEDIIRHRISYWSNRIDDRSIIEKFSQIEEYINVHSNDDPVGKDDFELDYLPRNYINLDAFVNHNYRALSNVLSELLDNPSYTDILMRDCSTTSSKPWKKVATLIFSLSHLYRNENVWSSMGFGCTDFSLVDYPTTLGRLILNNLYAARQGKKLNRYAADRPDIPTNASVALEDIINDLYKVKFLNIDTSLSSNELFNQYNSSELETTDLIIERLADMCARTSRLATSSYGYDAEVDELWRRPLYFTGGLKLKHTAASHDELKEHFRKSLETDTANRVMFSITDEGLTLINDIVASFEFYSARYCNVSTAKPLHQATSVEELNALIKPVFDAIQRCCERNIFFKDQYLMQYRISLNQYLRCSFHPRTKPRFNSTGTARMKLASNSFRPQLHIVRVIYTHIAYFNTIKNVFAKSEEKIALCKCLTEWIAEYLLLYKDHFYSLLKDTVCKYDNKVYELLNNLKDEQLKQYALGRSGKNISIARKSVLRNEKNIVIGKKRKVRKSRKRKVGKL